MNLGEEFDASIDLVPFQRGARRSEPVAGRLLSG